MAISDYLNELVNQKNQLADNLNTKGVTVDENEKLNTLVPKVLDIQSGGTVVKIDDVQSEKDSLNLTTLNSEIDSILISSDKFNIKSLSHSVSTLPYNFYHGSAVVYNNEIHILGSYDSSNRTNHYKWNGSTWTSVSTLPYSFYNGSAVVYNNEIHILGSYYDSSNYTKHYKWDGSSWTKVSTLPYNFYDGSAVVYNNQIHILGSADSNYSGGVTTYPYAKYHYKYNGSSWTKVSTLPYEFYYGSAVVYKVYNNEIHILGSNDSSGYDKHYKWNGSTWTSVSTLPYSFPGGSAVVYNNQIHILGGSSNNYTKHHFTENYYTGTQLLSYISSQITNSKGNFYVETT